MAMEGEKSLIRPGYKLLKSALKSYNGNTKRHIKTDTGNSSDNMLDAIIGDLLGDGHMRFSGRKRLSENEYNNRGNARMEFTFSTANLPYVRYLKFVAYSDICTISEPTPWPNPKSGKPVSQY
jgi:hypothetical protein